jgi:hypothetical protein
MEISRRWSLTALRCRLDFRKKDLLFGLDREPIQQLVRGETKDGR